jgi:hypothetical protein
LKKTGQTDILCPALPYEKVTDRVHIIKWKLIFIVITGQFMTYNGSDVLYNFKPIVIDQQWSPTWWKWLFQTN